MTAHGLATLLALILGLTAAGFYFWRLKLLRQKSRQTWRQVAETLRLHFRGDDEKAYPLLEGSLDGVDLVVAVEREYVGYFTYHDTLISVALPEVFPQGFQMETRSSADTLRAVPAEIEDQELNHLFHFPPPFPRELRSFFSTPTVRDALLSATSQARSVSIEEGRFCLRHRGILTVPDELEEKILAIPSLAQPLIDAATTSADDGPSPSPPSR